MTIQFPAMVTFTASIVLFISFMTSAAEPNVSATTADGSEDVDIKPVTDSRRFQAVLIHGQTAILDRDTGKLVLIRPDMTTTVVLAPVRPVSGSTQKPVLQKDNSVKPSDQTQTVNPPLPLVITPELRQKAELVCARYLPKLGPICIASLSESGVVVDVVIRNSGDMILRAIEFTFRGRSDAGHIEIQRVYVNERVKDYDILPRPGERRQVRFMLDQLSASDIVMDVSYLLLGDKAVEETGTGN